MNCFVGVEDVYNEDGRKRQIDDGLKTVGMYVGVQ